MVGPITQEIRHIINELDLWVYNAKYSMVVWSDKKDST
jgi:hypothetical protein